MLSKKEIQKGMTALEDVKGLYSQLEQTADDQLQKQEFKIMLQNIEQHYQYLNETLLSLGKTN